MDELRVIVCVKVVPRSEEIRVDTETMMLVRQGVRSEINPPDMNVLEMALQLKDRYGARVDMLSMGPPDFEGYLLVGLAMGADHVYLLSDQAFAGADTLATTYTLAKGIEKMGDWDLVICGEESADGATGQVPAGLAEWLDVGQLTLLTEIDIDHPRRVATGRRELSGGYEILEVPMPCVVSVKTACNEPRFMDYSLKDQAFENGHVIVWGAQDLEVDRSLIGLTGSPTIVTGLAEAATRERKRQFLEGTPGELAGKIGAILEQEL